MKACLTCVFAHEQAAPAVAMVGAEKKLECRRHPPSVLLIPERGGLNMSSFFPAVLPDTWCGEYAEKAP